MLDSDVACETVNSHNPTNLMMQPGSAVSKILCLWFTVSIDRKGTYYHFFHVMSTTTNLTFLFIFHN